MSQKQDRVYLSANWVECVDKKSGKKYFANLATRETVWKRPSAKIQEDIEKNGAQPVPLKKKKKKTPPQNVWLERQDPETGKTYYYNPALKSTSWHRPDDDKVVTTDVHTKQGKGQWLERVDPRTGRPFYYNPVLKVTRWDNPEEQNAPSAAAAKENGVPAQNRVSLGINPLKRISMMAGNLVAASKRLSGGGGSQRSLGFGGDPNRLSASFGADTPAIPVNKNGARVSLRLGANDMFANIRAMQNSKPISVRLTTTNDQKSAEEFLQINLQQEMETVSLVEDGVDFMGYARNHFLQRTKGFFGGKTVDLVQATNFSPKQIKNCLTDLPNKLMRKDAKLSFKYLLLYSTPSSKKFGDAIVAQDFVRMGVQTSPLFQDEMYSQLIKQSRRNTTEQSLENVLQLIALCGGVFVPSDTLKPFLLSHLKTLLETTPSDRVKNLALYALLRIERYVERLHYPSIQEIAAVVGIVPVDLTIEMISTNPVTIQVDSWTTVKDIKERIQARFNIKEGEPFSLFELSNGDNERHLSDSDNILDVLGFWELNGGDFQCLYKIRLFFDINEEDTAAVELTYLQTVFEVLDQRYPCEEESALELAALEAQEKFGDYDGTDVFENQLASYLPPRFYDPEKETVLKDKIFEKYATLKGMDKFQAMINYVSVVKTWKFYGCSYFFADPVQLKVLGKEFPQHVLIAVNSKGVMIVDHQTKGVIVEYPYSEVVTWGQSESHFVLVVGNIVRSTKLFFETEDGGEIVQLIHSYVNKLMEAQTEEEKDNMFMKQFGEEEGADEKIEPPEV